MSNETPFWMTEEGKSGIAAMKESPTAKPAQDGQRWWVKQNWWETCKSFHIVGEGPNEMKLSMSLFGPRDVQACTTVYFKIRPTSGPDLSHRRFVCLIDGIRHSAFPDTWELTGLAHVGARWIPFTADYSIPNKRTGMIILNPS